MAASRCSFRLTGAANRVLAGDCPRLGFSLDLEPRLPQLGKELVFDEALQALDAGRASLELATRAVAIVASEHLHAVADSSDRRFEGALAVEREAQLTNAPADVAVGIRRELFRQLLQAQQDQLDP